MDGFRLFGGIPCALSRRCRHRRLRAFNLAVADVFMSVHLSSFVVLCRPQKLGEARATIAALPGVEIHYCGGGKIVAIAEGGSEKHISDALAKMQDIPGVVAANMVYHGVEYAEDETDGYQHGG